MKKKSSIISHKHETNYHDELAKLPFSTRRIVHQLSRPIVKNHIQPVIDMRQHVKRLKLFKRVLARVDIKESPNLWARLQNDYAISLLESPVEDHAQNLEHAIDACNAALEMLSRTVSPTLWAKTQINLGIAYDKRIKGDPIQNAELAIAANNAALEVSTQTDSPIEWAMAKQNLGCVYARRIIDDRAENLERAIEMFTEGLEVFTQTGFPFYWARTQNNLGFSFIKRIRGDRAENLECAISFCNAALGVCTKDKFPQKWADIQNNLGFAYIQRIRGDRAENLECAISSFTAALEVYGKASFPRKWADIHKNLGLALIQRIRNDRAENLERAISSCTDALEVYTKTDFPQEWAITKNTLGNALRERIDGDPTDNFERSIEAFTAALEIYRRDNYPIEWATAQASLGVAFSERMEGDPVENIKNAVAAYNNAIYGFQECGLKDEVRKFAGNLGHLLYKEAEWMLAYNAYGTAISALEAVRNQYFSEDSKVHLAKESSHLYTHMADTCIQIGRLREALELVEASKARIFLAQIGYNTLPSPVLSSTEQLTLEEEARLILKLQESEKAIRYAIDDTQRRDYMIQKEKIMCELDKVWTELESIYPAYISMRRGYSLKYKQIQTLVDSIDIVTAFVEFCTMPKEIIAFVLRTGDKQPTVVRLRISQDDLVRYAENYVREVLEYPDRGDIGQSWQNLSKPLFENILPYLEGVELVYLIPYGILHFLPLHALCINGCYLIDRFPIVYAPSATVLGRLMQPQTERLPKSKLHGALVLGYTPHEWERPTFEGEAEQVAKLFGVKPHLGQNAKGALLQKVGIEYPIIHLSCHGFVDFQNPLRSGLLLADGKLTVRDIMRLNLNADLMTVSACHTGIGDPKISDELMGLTRPILEASVRSAMVSLWSVDAKATLTLMTNFYDLLLNKNGINVNAKAVALREAIKEVKKEKKWEHPYYWSLFILVGDWR